MDIIVIRAFKIPGSRIRFKHFAPPYIETKAEALKVARIELQQKIRLERATYPCNAGNAQPGN